MTPITPEWAKTAPDIPLKPNRHFDLTDIPYKYQKRGILMMLLCPRMVLGDDVGLGKTLESIVAFTYLKTKNPNLKAVVFTERATLFQWKKEIEWLTKGLTTQVITPTTIPGQLDRKKAFTGGRWDIAISTYASLYRYLPYLKQGLGPEYVVIADEASYFKNHDTVLFERMKELSYTAKRFYALSATIIENRLEEAYVIIRITAPGTIPSEKFFLDRFCIRKTFTFMRDNKKRRGIHTVGYKNLDQFRKLIEPVFYGRLQTNPEVEQQLPTDIHKDLEIELSREQSQKFLEARNKLLELATGEVVQLTILPSLIRMQQLANSPSLLGFDIEAEKEQVLIDSLTGSLAGQQTVVYSKMRSQIDLLEKLVHATGTKYGRITGKEDDYQREQARADFEAHKIQVLLITRAGGRAMNLQAGAHLIVYDLPWSYGQYRQLVGRLKRTGSKHKSIGVYRYLARLHPSIRGEDPKTIDHYTLETIMRKKALFNAVLGDDTTIENSPSDLTDIYQAIRAGTNPTKRVPSLVPK